MQYSLYWPTATVHQLVGLVNSQSQYGQPIATSSPYIRQHGPHAGDLGMPGQPIRTPAQVANCKVTLNSRFVACDSLKKTQANPLCPPMKLILYKL